MKFLDAHKIASQFAGGPPLPFLLAMSGQPERLDVFLKAVGATHGRSVIARVLPFNTLGQHLMTDGQAGEREVFVLMPWDLVPEADWRSGFATSALEVEALQARAQQTATRLARRKNARLLYLTAPLPPLFENPAKTLQLEGWLSAMAASIGAQLLPAEFFSMGTYLSTGSPFSSARLGDVAEAIVKSAAATTPEPKKVLVTDLDNVMWRGVIGEDGLDGIHYRSEGAGFRHFIYQSFLAKLKREGTLLAAVSRNDPELANGPFLSGRMTLKVDDFVVIAASYNAKSSQIREIAKQLNLGLDSFVFVDDNPVEVEEVSAAIPEMRVIRFPENDDALPAFFNEVASQFARTIITTEDADRTAMYRRRLEGMMPVEAEGADLTEFLRGLEMSLTITDRSEGDRTRAVQLINKTNQFNVNGRRVTDEEVGAMLAAGGRLFTCTLSDRTGSHGEIFSCLIDASGVIRSLVMSCRVFQRRVEHAFFVWLAAQDNPPKALEYAQTPRNEPVAQFLNEPAFSVRDGELVLADWKQFTEHYGSDLGLFVLAVPQGATAG